MDRAHKEYTTWATLMAVTELQATAQPFREWGNENGLQRLMSPRRIFALVRRRCRPAPTSRGHTFSVKQTDGTQTQ
jgi:hypothetical protein